MKSILTHLALLLLLPSLGLGQPKSGEGQVQLDFHDVDLRDVVNSIAEITGKNFVIGDRVRGKVTIISPKPVTVDEAYQAFLSALEIKNLCAVDVGKITKIVPLNDCKKLPIPTEMEREIAVGDQVVTRLIPLKYISSNEIRQALTGLVSRSGSIVAYGPTNTLIITDSASNVRRLVTIIDRLDKQGFKASVEVIPLKNSTASDIAEKLTTIFERDKDAIRRRRTDDVEGTGDITKIMPDDRTNSLIVVATREGLERVLDLVAELDREVQMAVEHGRIHVKYLQHADAEELAKILSGLISGTATAKGKKKSAESSAARRGFSAAPPLPWEQGGTAEPGLEGEGMGAAPASSSGDAIVQGSGRLFQDEIRVAADPGTNSLIVTASPTDWQLVSQVIDQLDIRRAQVFVEALIMEVNVDKALDVGVSGMGTAALTSSLGALASTSFGLSPLALAGIKSQGDLSKAVGPGGPAAGLVLGALTKKTFTIPGTKVKIPAEGALLRAFQESGAFNLLSAPNILTSDNKKAEILVGRDVPMMTATQMDANNKPINSFSRQKVGLQLAVTPQINEGDEVTLEIEQKIQEVERPSGQFSDITTSERSAKTTVVAQSGQTIVIGGLIQDKDEKKVQKVPLLGDIPILGHLFRETSLGKRKMNLVIFLTPHVIHDANDLTRVSVKKNNERRRFYKKQGIGENKALYDYDLDSGLNMAAPPPRAPGADRKETERKRRFDYDKPTPEESGAVEENVLSRRQPKSPGVTSTATRDSEEGFEFAENERARKRSRSGGSGNPFADVRPPSSTR